ncbi:DUF427 domain-containing protein [Psychroflexus sp. YR1-1]|uniref:DUF427 domain-containing protein n=1 Tax=Psychroflexus aurantiacus TaxID=2709310 RepID=A0A6B3R012_9FLAO|nr:DUF427 domain-containing protein [Psychroflexus aurantiacus]NEV93829.1 DUF427 domain-containing protein [Psychroflexus aurantiacus]
MKAIWNEEIIAESEDTILIEGNHYFPPQSINTSYFEESDYHTHCPWKGEASYYTILVEAKKNENAAWYYPDPKPAAEKIENYVAFWKGVQVKE